MTMIAVPARSALTACLTFALLCASAAAQTLKPVAKGLDHPWGLAFLPDGSGRMLVTERPGRMRIVERNGTLSAPLAGLPPVVAVGQGGLLDVALHPKFADNRLVYWSYSEAAESGQGGAGTTVARGRLDGNALADVQVIFRQEPKASGGNHFGSRLVFARDGRLFVTLGERFIRKDDAQVLSNHLGKLIRIEDDGRVPADNPFVGRADAKPEIWSYGHRNMQGAALNPATGALWTTEHGPQGGDELNIEAAGKNYGWPVITYGRNYGSGTKIGEGTERSDIAAPIRYWVPISIAPSGMAFVTSERYPGWKGNLLLGAMRGERLVRLELDGNRVVAEHALFQDQGLRFRDVRQGPDGWLYVLTDSEGGQILRVER
jgi:aldose sugar dehydrogenase